MQKIIIVTVVILAGILALGFYVNSTKPEVVQMTREEALTITPEDHVWGNREADVVVFEFLDFQCPACRAYFPVVEQLKETVDPESVAIVTRHFPLNFHIQARDAAFAYEAAYEQDRGTEMKALLFGRQDDWSGNRNAVVLFESYAEELGLDVDQFNSDRNSELVRARVETALDSGYALGVNSTPSFYLQGEKVTPGSLEEFQALIQSAQAQVVPTEETPDADATQATSTEE